MDAFFSRGPAVRLKREFLLGQFGFRLCHNVSICDLFPVTFRLVSLCSLFSYHCDKKQSPWLEQLREGLVSFSSQFQRFSPWQQEAVTEGTTHNYVVRKQRKTLEGSCSLWGHRACVLFSPAGPISKLLSSPTSVPPCWETSIHHGSLLQIFQCEAKNFT